MNSNRKGKVGERELATKFREYGFTAKRGQQHKGGPDSADVEVEEWPDVHIECKRTEKLQLYPAMKQAIRDCGDKVPVVIHRRNGEEWVVVMRLDDFVKTDTHSTYFFEQVKKWQAAAMEARCQEG